LICRAFSGSPTSVLADNKLCSASHAPERLDRAPIDLLEADLNACEKFALHRSDDRHRKALLKLLAYFATTGLLLSLSLHCHAQLSITNGNFRVTLPASDWQRQTPPRAITDPLTKSGATILFYVESSTAKFFVSRFDFRPGANPVSFIAGFARGVRNSFAKTGAQVEEHIGSFRGTQLQSFAIDANIQDTLIHTEAVFCADKVYSIQIAGPQSDRVELLKLLDSITIRDMPMDRTTFDRGLQPNALEKSRAYEMGRRFGTLLAFPLIAGIAFVLFKIFSRIGNGPKRPPPLPPNGRAT